MLHNDKIRPALIIRTKSNSVLGEHLFHTDIYTPVPTITSF